MSVYYLFFYVIICLITFRPEWPIIFNRRARAAAQKGDTEKMPKSDIKLGYSCNNDCVHCVIADHRDLVFSKGLPEDIPAEKYKKELLDSRSRTDSVVFTGGEPTIRPELLDLIAYARDLGFTINIQTNGRRLHRMDFAQAICAIAPLSFTIALHGPNPQVHDAVTQRENSFYETVQGIRNVIEIMNSASQIGGKLVISKVNAGHLADTARFMIALGMRSISLTFPHACGNARKYFYEVVPRYSEIKHQILDTIRTCLHNRVAIQTEAIPFCFLPEVEYVCSELNMANDEYTELKQYGDEEIVDWNTLRVKIKRKGPRCCECRFDKICEGPWMEYPEKYGTDELVPVPGEPVLKHRDVICQNYMPEQPRSRAFSFAIDNIWAPAPG